MPGAGGLRTRAAPHRHRGRVPGGHITAALAGRRCTPRRRSEPALPHIAGALGGGRRKPRLRSVAATLTDIPMPCALALGPLGTGKGGLQLTGRRHTQLAALQAGPHAPMAPAQPHRLDAPLRGGVAEAQFPHRVVEQAKTLVFHVVPSRTYKSINSVHMTCTVCALTFRLILRNFAYMVLTEVITSRGPHNSPQRP